MVLYGFIWSYMVLYGFIWFYMVLYGLIWSYMVLYGFIWFYMVLYGFIWSYMVLYGFIWFYMVLYGFIWFYMVLYGLLWFYMVLYGIIWSYMVLYDFIWFYMVLYGVIWFYMVLYGFKLVLRLVSYGVVPIKHGDSWLFQWVGLGGMWSGNDSFCISNMDNYFINVSGFLAVFLWSDSGTMEKTSTYIYIEKLNETTSEISVAIWNSHQLDPKNVSGSQSLLECPWQSSAFPGGKSWHWDAPVTKSREVELWNCTPKVVSFHWLVVQCAHLEKWWSSSVGKDYPIYIMEHKKCSKPPTSNFHHVSSAVAFHASVSSNAGIAKENLGSPFRCTSVL